MTIGQSIKMPLQTLLSSLGLVFLTELGDKTMLTVLCLSARYRKPWFVLLSTMSALAASSSIAVFVGYALSASLPIGMITYVSGFLFLVLGLYTLAKSNSDDEVCENPSTMFGMFSLVLFSELGDKSQITVLALAAQSLFPIIVFLGALGGFLVVNAIGAVAGDRVALRIPMDKVRLATGFVFILFGFLVLFGVI